MISVFPVDLSLTTHANEDLYPTLFTNQTQSSWNHRLLPLGEVNSFITHPLQCKAMQLASTLAHDASSAWDRLLTSPFTQNSTSEVARRGCGGLQLQLRVRLRFRLRNPKPVALASHFSDLETTGFGFGFQIIFLEAAGFGCGFLSFKMEATGFGFGLGFLSPSWLRPRLRSHQPGFQPNPASEVLLAIYLVLPFTKHQAISKAGQVNPFSVIPLIPALRGKHIALLY